MIEDSGLLSQLGPAFGTKCLGIGQHRVLHAKDRNQRFCISSLWMALIKPAFDPPSVLAVAHTDSGTKALYVERRGDPAVPGTHVLAVPMADWEDELLPAVKEINLFPQVDTLTLDGISYQLHTETVGLAADFRFGNPREAQLLAVEQALLRSARAVVAAQASFVKAESAATDGLGFKPGSSMTADELVYGAANFQAWQKEIQNCDACLKTWQRYAADSQKSSVK
ncbi:MAG TPA: hypothetical protein PK280_02255 [Planctomycetota bacterium]|nr:hypothetical protein [Planctomycetota bacterium]